MRWNWLRAAGGGIISLEGFFDQRAAQSKQVKSKNIFGVDFGVTAQHRALVNGHLGGILWFSGLSGSGKSTIAKQVQKRLFDKGYQVVCLDGDNVRKGLNRDLGFAPEDRKENIRRVSEVAALFAQAGMIVITSFISPYREDRRNARAVAPDCFHSIYIKASLEACETRDTKGLYKQAREGKLADFTGISAPYEEPQNPDLVIDTEKVSTDDGVNMLLRYVEHHLVDPVKNMAMEGGSDYAGTGI
jgi:bifunctional enzyme CysN/CysC